MSASTNGSAGLGQTQPQTTMVPQFQQLNSLGTTGGSWLNELKNLGYMPTGQSSWGNIGQTVMVPQVVKPSVSDSQPTLNDTLSPLGRYLNQH